MKESRSVKKTRPFFAAVLSTAGILLSVSAVAAHAAGSHAGSHAHSTSTGETAFGVPGTKGIASRTVSIRMSDAMRFSPAVVNVKLGETIRFVVTNPGKLKHEFVLGTMNDLKEHAEVMKKHPDMQHDEEHHAVDLKGGERGSLLWKFTKGGEFYFGCLIPGHFDAGMIGKIVVR
jgi:uncharacterized cupredoxin-like copper-binding protein